MSDKIVLRSILVALVVLVAFFCLTQSVFFDVTDTPSTNLIDLPPENVPLESTPPRVRIVGRIVDAEETTVDLPEENVPLAPVPYTTSPLIPCTVFALGCVTAVYLLSRKEKADRT